MESELVKEIKKLIDCDKKQNELGGIIVVNRQFLIEVIALINDLERANERLKDSNKNILFVNEHVIKQNDDLTKENERLKNRIATLERKLDAKESYYNAVKDRALEVFANKLIEKAIKLGWQGLGTTDIDETLKEILKNG